MILYNPLVVMVPAAFWIGYAYFYWLGTIGNDVFMGTTCGVNVVNPHVANMDSTTTPVNITTTTGTTHNKHGTAAIAAMVLNGYWETMDPTVN